MGVHNLRRIVAVVAVTLFVVLLLFASAVGAQNRDARQSCTIVVSVINNSQYINIDNARRAQVVQYISQEFNISPRIVQACVQEIREGGDNGNNNDTTTEDTTTGDTTTGDTTTDTEATTGETTAATGEQTQDVIAGTIPDKPLPDTGGLHLLGLAALGLASVVAGASALRAGTRRRR